VKVSLHLTDGGAHVAKVPFNGAAHVVVLIACPACSAAAPILVAISSHDHDTYYADARAQRSRPGLLMKTYGTVNVMRLTQRARSRKPDVYEMVPALALTPTDKPLVVTELEPFTGEDPTPEYTVTHVPTGQAIGHYKNAKKAKAALEDLVPLTDWTRSKAEISADVALGAMVRAVKKKHGDTKDER
jgi:hypothetical protein